MNAYYNENDPYAAQWLRNLIAAGHIAPGDVDERSITDVQPDDLTFYDQCHFFAGIGGWSLAARLAGWPDDRKLWTGSCPCQPFSVAGKGAGADDERHLWPDFFRLIRACRPPVVMGEQVAAAIGKDWLDGVLADLEGIDYAGRAVVVPACAVNAPHRRDRLWFVADMHGSARGQGHPLDARCDSRSNAQPRAGSSGSSWGDPCAMANSGCERLRGERSGAIAGASCGMQGEDGQRERVRPDAGPNGVLRAWHEVGWIIGYDGKARRVKPGLPLLAHGVPARVGKLRAYGNAVVPQVAAEVIAAYIEYRP